MTARHQPLRPLPDGWTTQPVAAYPNPLGYDDKVDAGTYQRDNDGLRVLVTDAGPADPLGAYRHVSASRPGGPLNEHHVRTVKKYFLRDDLPIETPAPMTNPGVVHFIQRAPAD